MTISSSAPQVEMNLAGPLDQVNAWVAQWGSAAQILGGTILGICMVVVGIQIGAKAMASDNASSGTRQGISKLTVLALSGIVIGSALLVVPMLINIGKNSGTTPAPAEPAAAATAPV